MEHTGPDRAILREKEKTIINRKAWIFPSILQRSQQYGVGTHLSEQGASGTSTKCACLQQHPASHDLAGGTLQTVLHALNT